MTSNESAGLEDRIFAVLMAHRRIPAYSTPGANRCVGCENLINQSDESNSPRHIRHLAALVASVVTTHPLPPGADHA